MTTAVEKRAFMDRAIVNAHLRMVRSGKLVLR